MNQTAIAILIRQPMVRILYLLPFLLGFFLIEPPLNILATCVLIIKSKLPNEADLYELQVLGKQAVRILTRAGSEDDKKEFELMKATFGFEEAALNSTDVDGSAIKFLVDTVFGLIEALVIFMMIIWYIVQIT